jgi:hypothetical protein
MRGNKRARTQDKVPDSKKRDQYGGLQFKDPKEISALNRSEFVERLSALSQAADRLGEANHELVADVKVALDASVPARIVLAIGRCAIKGCDIHIFDASWKIVSHLKASHVTEPVILGAKDLLMNAPDSVIAVILFEDNRAELVHLDGESEIVFINL